MVTLSAIHPQSVVSPAAQIGPDVEVGPFAVIEEGAVLGAGCRVATHAVIKRGTVLGQRNEVCEGAVLGGLPQHTKVPERPGGLVVGSGNTIRENCTLHRSLIDGQNTIVGDNNLLMVGVHVAHDCIVGNHVILTNNVMLAGHVEVGDRAYFGGGAAAHQFCRIGQLAMVGGYAQIKKDVPPFLMVDNASSLIVGLNKVGLKRSGFSSEDIADLKAAYRLIYRSGLTWREIVPALEAEYSAGPAAEFHRFLAGGSRGLTRERRAPAPTTIRLRAFPGDEAEVQSKAG